MKKMAVNLTSYGNPDFGQSPYRSMSDSYSMDISSLKEASEVCREFIKEWFLGAGNWSGGEILDNNGNFIGYVSYNGKVWDTMPQNWNDKSKCLYNPFEN